MSAFIVGHAHIDALLTYAVAKRLYFYDPEAAEARHITAQTADEIGRILLLENERSVAYRYPGTNDLPGTIGEEANAYAFHYFTGPMSALQAIKAARCLDYQSCEHPEWEASLAKRIVDAIIVTAVADLPGYDKTAWEIRSAA